MNVAYFIPFRFWCNQMGLKLKLDKPTEVKCSKSSSAFLGQILESTALRPIAYMRQRKHASLLINTIVEIMASSAKTSCCA